MRRGKYNKNNKSTSWIRRLEQPKFTIKNIDKYGVYPLNGGCGTSALSMITGISPKVIDMDLPKHLDHWSDLRMKSFLRARGYTVTEITVNRVTPDCFFKEPPITMHHVLLAGQNIYNNEGTWAVINKGMRYHNFDMEILNPLEFINNPTDTLYAITHKKWGYKP